MESGYTAWDGQEPASPSTCTSSPVRGTRDRSRITWTSTAMQPATARRRASIGPGPFRRLSIENDRGTVLALPRHIPFLLQSSEARPS